MLVLTTREVAVDVGAVAIETVDSTWVEVAVALYCLHVLVTTIAVVLVTVRVDAGFVTVVVGVE